mmetsp:Transcript_119621/g.381724  ORF Transcript_119621/g.381724 Transcript_119621/m.381724 type:complete len:323 (-) Transcript_119621:46-1014(-)
MRRWKAPWSLSTFGCPCTEARTESSLRSTSCSPASPTSSSSDEQLAVHFRILTATSEAGEPALAATSARKTSAKRPWPRRSPSVSLCFRSMRTAPHAPMASKTCCAGHRSPSQASAPPAGSTWRIQDPLERSTATRVSSDRRKGARHPTVALLGGADDGGIGAKWAGGSASGRRGGRPHGAATLITITCSLVVGRTAILTSASSRGTSRGGPEAASSWIEERLTTRHPLSTQTAKPPFCPSSAAPAELPAPPRGAPGSAAAAADPARRPASACEASDGVKGRGSSWWAAVAPSAVAGGAICTACRRSLGGGRIDSDIRCRER